MGGVYLTMNLIVILFGVGSGSFLLGWFSLEMNMLAFLSLIGISKSLSSSNAMMKYFLVQGLASSLFLGGCLMAMIPVTSVSSNLVVESSLLMKLGAAPFHLWFIGMMEEMSFGGLFLLATLQKALPLMLLYSENSELTEMSLFLCILVAIGGASTSIRVKSFLGVSSVFSLSWLFASISDMEIMYFYFLVYSLSLGVFLLGMGSTGVLNMSELGTTWIPPMNLIMATLGSLSLSGLPPLMGFFGKIAVLCSVLSKGGWLLSFILILSSIYMLYLYISLFYGSLTTSSSLKFIKTQSPMAGGMALSGFFLIMGVVPLWLCISVWHLGVWASED